MCSRAHSTSQIVKTLNALLFRRKLKRTAEMLNNSDNNRIVSCSDNSHIVSCSDNNHIVLCSDSNQFVSCSDNNRIVLCSDNNRIVSCSDNNCIFLCNDNKRIVSCSDNRIVLCSDNNQFVSCSDNNQSHCRSDDSLKIVISRVDTTWNSRPVRTAASIGKSPRLYGHYVMHLEKEASPSPAKDKKTARRSLLYSTNNNDPHTPNKQLRNVETSQRSSKRKAQCDSSEDDTLVTPKRRHLVGNYDPCQSNKVTCSNSSRADNSPRKTPSHSKKTGLSDDGTVSTPSGRTPSCRSRETARTPSKRTPAQKSSETVKTPSGRTKSHGSSGTPRTPSGRTTSQRGDETPRSSRSKPPSWRSLGVEDTTPRRESRRPLVSEVVFQSDSSGQVSVERGESQMTRLRPR